MALADALRKRLPAGTPLPVRARVTGRPWWELEFRDGRRLSEADGVDWVDAPRAGRVAVRLYCPDGRVPVLGNSVDASGRLFQLTEMVVRLGAPDPEAPARERRVERRGASVLVWDTAAPPAPKVARYRRPRWEPVGREAVAHVVGMVRDTDGGCALYAWEYDDAAPAGGRLVGPLLDHVAHLAYHGIGPLAADVLGVAL